MKKSSEFDNITHSTKCNKKKRKNEKKNLISIFYIQIYLKQKFLINKAVKRIMFRYNAVNTYLDE